MGKVNVNAAIKIIDSGKKYPAVDLIRRNPQAAAVISKLVNSDRPLSTDKDGNRTLTAPDKGQFNEVSRSVHQRIKDAETALELFPDLSLSAQILVSSIISPKDMVNNELDFKPSETNKWPIDVSAKFVTKIKDHLDENYKIRNMPSRILHRCLFEAGSDPYVILPESTVDDLINGSVTISTEALSHLANKDGVAKHRGILGPAQIKERKNNNIFSHLSLESASTGYSGIEYEHRVLNPGYNNNPEFFDYISVTDNVDALKFPKLVKKLVSKRVSNIVHRGKTSLESYDGTQKLNDSQISSLIYKEGKRDFKPVVKVKSPRELTRGNVDSALIIRLPSESVIPVYVPGNPEEHIGFYVMIDSDGNPLTDENDETQWSEYEKSFGTSNQSMPSYMLNLSNKSLNGSCTVPDLRGMSDRFTEIVESDLIARLKNGVYGSNVSLASNQQVYRIMLSRMFKKQQTQLLYVPIELMTYFAFDYDKNGIGKSLLDGMSTLISMRAMNLFARTMASIRNSIGHTSVEIQLDEDDPDVDKTIEETMHEVGRTRQHQYFPLGISLGDIGDWLLRAGLDFKFSNHPAIPNMTLNYQESTTNYPKPDEDLDNELRKQTIMRTGLSPETVDNGFNTEFATTAVANNILLSKRVIQTQELFLPQMTDFARKIAISDPVLYKELKKIAEDNYEKIKEVSKNMEIFEDIEESDKKSYIVAKCIQDMLETFEVALPAPDIVTDQNLATAFDNYNQLLEKGVDQYINSNVFNEAIVGQELSQSTDTLKGIVMSAFMRKWMASNNVLPELADILSDTEAGSSVMNIITEQKSFIGSALKTFTHLIKDTKKLGFAADQDIEKMTGGEGLSGNSSSSYDSGSSDDTTNDDFGMDDFGSEETGTEENEDTQTQQSSEDKGESQLPDLDSFGA